MKFEISQVEEWQNVIDTILPQLNRPVLLLKGNLGAGKTTFSQFLLKTLGSTDEVNSPTYSIVNEYQTPKGKIFHFDLYRLKNIDEAYDFGIEEYLDNAFLCIIEWPEVYEDELLPEEYREIKIETIDGKRLINFQ